MTSDLERIGRENGMFFTASELMARDFPEPRWAVPGLIAEGLNLLVGAPKLGKSWLCLGLAVAVASGGKALGKIDVEPGTVLYAALEDPPRRLQDRLSIVLGDSPVPARLQIATGLPRMPDAVAWLSGWVDDHADARLVIVDVLRKIRPPAKGNASMYEDDYEIMSQLKGLADRHQIAVVVVSHTRKAVDESDVFNEVSGSTGLTGAADAILIAKRGRNEVDAVLHVTGRDINEHEYGMSWDKRTCTWSLLEEPLAVASLSTAQRTIHRHLDATGGDTPKGVTDATGLASGTVKTALRRMADKGQIDTDGKGLYFPVQPATAATVQPTHVPTVAELHGLQVARTPMSPGRKAS